MTTHVEGTQFNHINAMPDPSIAVLKTEMRRVKRSQRRQLSPEQRAQCDRAINQHLVNFVTESGVSSLSAFWPFDGEPDLRSSLTSLESTGMDIALPVLESGQRTSMKLHRWRQQSVMVENQFKIPEPALEPVVETLNLDLLLIPLVAWDRKGRRLGMGAGYYDRLLTPLRAMSGPRLIGVAYGVQEVDEVPVDHFDVPLHGLISENGRIQF
ncbi:MAG: 5-formyltetrahydrofolate cyclo-ligase [Lysobacterales bacterium]